MRAKAVLLFGLRIIVLTLILFGLYSVDYWSLTLSEEVRTAPAMLLLVSLLQAVVLSYPIVRARWSGWKLVGAVFLVFYGITTLMVAIEGVYLPDELPPHLVRHLLVNGAITAAILSPVAVLIHGRMKPTQELEGPNLRLIMSWSQWLWRLAVIAFSWAVLFVFFGALVYLPLAHALDPTALQALVSPDLPSWVLPFQMIRALLWTVLTLPVIRMMKGNWWETGFGTALLFSVLLGSNLLMPTGMPAGLQLAHLIEVCGEAFVFGWIVVALLHRRTKRRQTRMVSPVRRQVWRLGHRSQEP
jgi:hypothetical protein